MNAAPVESSSPSYSWAFRARRGRNWIFLGLLYAGFYLCRYNLSTVTPEMAREFNYSNKDIGWMSTGRDLGYAFGQLLNGLFADALGGKQSMAIGAIGTILLNLAFGAFSHFKWDALFLLAGFVLIRVLDGYAQAFGAPGMVKINTAWFQRTERGRFAGIFGAMIQLGQIGSNKLSAILLSGQTIAIFGVTLLIVPQLNWRSMIFIPPIVLSVLLVLAWLNVKNHPEEAGFSVRHDDDSTTDHAEKIPLLQVFRTIASNPLIWVNAGAYFCTGFVRRAYDFWWAKYLDNSWHVTKESSLFGSMGFWLPTAAILGSFAAGWLSDNVFKSRRSPVAALLYGLETIVIIGAVYVLGYSGFASPMWGAAFLILISLTCNTSHSIIGTAAVMDIGGRRMAGFALGVVNSFQYLGTLAAGAPLGSVIDHYGWVALFAAMLPFSVLGTILMATLAIRTRGREVRGA